MKYNTLDLTLDDYNRYSDINQEFKFKIDKSTGNIHKIYEEFTEIYDKTGNELLIVKFK